MKNPLFTKVLQIGFVVNDCEKTAQKYADIYGIGPWNIYEADCMKSIEQYEQSSAMQLKIASTFLADIEFELIEPLDNLSLYVDFLKQHGEGLHHLALKSSFQQAMNFCKHNDIPIILSGIFGIGENFAYIDATKDIKCIIELYNSQPGSSYPNPSKIIPG